MKTSYEKFKIMLLRPAVYNGKEAEIVLQLENAGIFRCNFAESAAIDMTPGDTVSIRGKVCFNEDDLAYEYITVYMGGDVLTKFIEKYGFNKITASVKMKLRLVYAIYDSCDIYSENKKEEISAFRLVEIL